ATLDARAGLAARPRLRRAPRRKRVRRAREGSGLRGARRSRGIHTARGPGRAAPRFVARRGVIGNRVGFGGIG
ncbi:hypothetical protein, partial [Burkholderia pseudomallei]